MNTPVAPPVPQATAATSLLKALGIVSSVCGLIIVAAYQGTYDAAAANRRLALERTVFALIPQAKSMDAWQATAQGIQPAGGEADAKAVKFYAAYDAQGALAGIAAEGAAKGYADTVKILYSYAPACRCITGFGVVASKETPGIGDKVTSDKTFLANFEALDARLDAELAGLANAIQVVKHGSKTQPWQIDAIAGATITSRAVGKAINDSARRLLPKLVPELEKLGKKAS